MKNAYKIELKAGAQESGKDRRPTMVRVLTKNRTHDMVKASVLPQLIRNGFVLAVIE